MKKIKVLIVDDSEVIRQLLTEIISSAEDLEVVATAEDPFDAREKIKQFNPDVLTLDIEMPKMDGITFLRNIMRLRPMPVIMISTFTQEGVPATLEALSIGAVDYVSKPQINSSDTLRNYTTEIQDKIRNAAKANLVAYEKSLENKSDKLQQHTHDSRKIIALGGSTGGTEAIRQVLQSMPVNCPPILLVQHIPATFSSSFAKRLNDQCDITVQEAKTGMRIKPGNAYLAPGDSHLEIKELDGHLVTCLNNKGKVNGHMPSLDVLFHSIAQHVGKYSVAAILTGMGSDGAQGIKRIFDSGGTTFAQDEDTSVVWGMPGSAIRLNAIQQILPIQKITRALLDACIK